MARPTVEQLADALADNADYEEANDLAKAKAYQTALRRKLMEPEDVSRNPGDRAKWNHEFIDKELKRVAAFIARKEAESRGGGYNFMCGSRWC